jgi:hypothetical protein
MFYYATVGNPDAYSREIWVFGNIFELARMAGDVQLVWEQFVGMGSRPPPPIAGPLCLTYACFVVAASLPKSSGRNYFEFCSAVGVS